MSLLLFDLFHELHQENVKWCILYVVSKRLVLQKVSNDCVLTVFAIILFSYRKISFTSAKITSHMGSS